MKKLIIALTLIFFLSGCQAATVLNQNSDLKVENTNYSDDKNINIDVKMANPASAFCIKNGGKLEGKTDKNGGQYNICVFNDDTRCEEWSYFNGNCEKGKNIVLFFPKNQEEVSFPFTFIGQARVFENTFNYRLKDSENQIIASGFSMTNAQDMGFFGDFEVEINNLFDLPESENVTLEVFEFSAKDGSEINLTSVPIKLKINETSKVNLFFNNNKLDPQISCNKVFSVSRITPKTQALAKTAIDLLLQGPSREEYKNGYQTSINSGVELKSVKIQNGTAFADFDQTLQAQVGGSCKVSAIRSQITETLKQFPTVKNVIISIDGQTEEILQP